MTDLTAGLLYPYIGAAPGQFTRVPQLLPYKTGEWVVMEDFGYFRKDGSYQHVPKYFITDLASIPWLAEPMFADTDSRLPGIVHDASYCFNQKPKAWCDSMLYEMLQVTGAPLMQSHLIYAGVKVGGASRYDACKGGPKEEDFAWELMTPSDDYLYKQAYGICQVGAERG
jgi:hypothetical protein